MPKHDKAVLIDKTVDHYVIKLSTNNLELVLKELRDFYFGVKSVRNKSPEELEMFKSLQLAITKFMNLLGDVK